jgi:serine protease Do
MKKYATLIIGVLLIWNTVLTFEYVGVKNLLDTLELTGEVKIIREVDTEFTTNFTKVVADNLAKVVGVSNYYQTELVSTGSGAIYQFQDGNVYIITNNHVIDGATKVTVTFVNGEELDAIVVGSDKFTDLALLKVPVDFTIEPENVFNIGDSSLTKVGETVLAIGSPLGFDFSGSVTMGIISGTDRIVPVDIDGDGVDDWDSIVLQTDAAINPGNSGGPLINMAGELIGITSMKIADSSVEGMGFAIPINEIVPIIEQLMANGKVIRPLLGVSGVSIDTMPSAQKSFYGIQLDLKKGIMITGVQAGSPASKAGLKAKDVITIFDGITVTSFKQFRRLLYGKAVGDTVEITYVRGTTTYTTSAKLE